MMSHHAITGPSTPVPLSIGYPIMDFERRYNTGIGKVFQPKAVFLQYYAELIFLGQTGHRKPFNGLDSIPFKESHIHKNITF